MWMAVLYVAETEACMPTMPKVCSVGCCKNNNVKNKGLRFFLFPKHATYPDRRQLWGLRCCRKNADGTVWEPRPDQTWVYVCAAHFVTGEPWNNIKHPDYAPSLYLTDAKFEANVDAIIEAKEALDRFTDELRRCGKPLPPRVEDVAAAPSCPESSHLQSAIQSSSSPACVSPELNCQSNDCTLSAVDSSVNKTAACDSAQTVLLPLTIDACLSPEESCQSNDCTPSDSEAPVNRTDAPDSTQAALVPSSISACFSSEKSCQSNDCTLSDGGSMSSVNRTNAHDSTRAALLPSSGAISSSLETSHRCDDVTLSDLVSCVNEIDVHGFTHVKSSTLLTFVTLTQDANPQVKMSVVIDNDCNYHVNVFYRRVSDDQIASVMNPVPHKILNKESLELLLRSLSSKRVCSGCDYSRYKDVVQKRDPVWQNVGENAVRHNQCHLLVQSGSRCPPCYAYRRRLYTRCKRGKKTKSTNLLSGTTPNSSLNPSDRKLKLKLLARQVKCLRKQVTSMRDRMKLASMKERFGLAQVPTQANSKLQLEANQCLIVHYSGPKGLL